VDEVPEVEVGAGVAPVPASGVDEEQAPARPTTNAIAHPKAIERVMRPV
jgi:hypothetical protein